MGTAHIWTRFAGSKRSSTTSGLGAEGAIKLLHSDCLTALRELADCSLDSLVTDPPAGIAFMGKDWDKDKGGRDAWVAWLTEVMRECLRVLKPGAHGLVWALPRTSHWTAMALEQAGFEVRDCVTHLFGTGFPKSLDVSKAIDKAAGAERPVVATVRNKGVNGMPDGRASRSQDAWDRDWSGTMDITAPATDAARQWQGWGTALKPAAEFWWLVRKPLGAKTVAANVLEHGTGAINIDGCRIATTDNLNGGTNSGDKRSSSRASFGNGEGGGVLKNGIGREFQQPIGRFPANVVLSDDAASMLGGAAKFFYCAKASRSDRNRSTGRG